MAMEQSMAKREEFFRLRDRWRELEAERENLRVELNMYAYEPGFWAARGRDVFCAEVAPVEDLAEEQLLRALRDAADDVTNHRHKQARAQLDALIDEAQRRRAPVAEKPPKLADVFSELERAGSEQGALLRCPHP
jgi:hypothetical protein